MPFVYLFFICIYNYCTSYTKFHNKNSTEFTCRHCFCTTNFNFYFFPLKVEFNFSVQRTSFFSPFLLKRLDSSKITVPDTAENKEVFDTHVSSATENQSAMALISTLHDSIKHLKLDLQVDRITQSERTLALKHIDHYCENYSDKPLPSGSLFSKSSSEYDIQTSIC